MPAGIAPAHDENATGPRDWRELAAMRAAHATMRHAALVRVNDAARVDALTNRRRAAWTAAAAARTAAERAAHLAELAKDPATKTDPAELAAATEANAAAQLAATAAAELAAEPWTVTPCPAPRCTGHAIVTDWRALRVAARHLHPIRTAPR